MGVLYCISSILLCCWKCWFWSLNSVKRNQELEVILMPLNQDGFPKRDWHWERFNALSDLGLIILEKNLIQIFPCSITNLKNRGQIIIHHSILIIYLQSLQLISDNLKSLMPQNNVNISGNFWFKWTHTRQKLFGFKVVTVNRLLSWHREK